MSYQGSAAYNMGAAERRRTRQEERPSFEVVDGGGLDASARSGVSPQFIARVKMVVAIALAVVALGMFRVVITSQCAAQLRTNNLMRDQITAAESLGEDLRIERSVLSSNSRIARIATQNLGMVFASESVSVTLADEPVEATNGDAAQSAAEGVAESAQA